eukprot:4579926-Pyramimonas_sp.AAC.1
MQLDAGWATAVRVYVAAAAKRAAVVKEDGLLAKADIQANPEKISKALTTEPKTWFDNACFKMQEIAKASNIMTSRYVYTLNFVKKTTRVRCNTPSGFV